MKSLSHCDFYITNCHTLTASLAVSETLASELEAFSVRVHLITLGAFRTNFAGAISLPVGPCNGVSAPYQGTNVDEVLEKTRQLSSSAPGDATLAAQQIVDIVTVRGLGRGVESCLRIVLGKDALDRGRVKVKILETNLEMAKYIAAATDYPTSLSIEQVRAASPLSHGQDREVVQ